VHFVTRLQLLVSRRILCYIYRLIEIVPTVAIEIVPTVPIEIVPTLPIEIVPTAPIEIVPTVTIEVVLIVLIEIVPKVEHKKQPSNTKLTSRGGSDCHTGQP
jgi:hypothetical protein